MHSDSIDVFRQIRAAYDDDTITVYQAYSPDIALPAVAAGRFVPPFGLQRMTWIKPSFLWMMYRSGWATKPGQEHVLAIRMSRTGFEWALTHSCLSHFEEGTYESHEQWAARRDATPVRIQWDPERSLTLQPLSYRSLQVGLSGEAARRYVNEWITNITDITKQVHQIHHLVEANNHPEALAMLPTEHPYPLPSPIATIIGASN